jgi:CRP-like cAMP-binding protein
MGCIQIKKLNDNEIIKSNNIENYNYNPNNKLETNPNKNDENLILLNNNLLNKKQEKKCDKQITKKTNNKTLNETKHEITETKKQEIPINKSEFNKITKAEISEIDKKKIENSLQNHFLFKNKSQNILSNIINSLQMQKLQPNTILFKKGDKGNYFYIIKEGNLEIIAEYGKKILNQDETFGELALIENKERTATVKSINYCILYLLNGKIFREIVSKINEDELLERLNFLKAISIFNVLNNVHLNSIALGMLKCEFEKGQMILYEGDVGQSIYIIKSGSVKCFKGDKEVRFLGPKNFFGESAVLFNTNRSLNVLVEENTVCYQISESLLIDIIGEEFKNVIISYLSKVSLKNSKYMKILSNEIFFEKVLENYHLKTFNNNDIIYDCKKNDYNKFYIIIYGNFINENNGEILASRNQLFGEEYIKKNSNSNFNIISKDECRTI